MRRQVWVALFLGVVLSVSGVFLKDSSAQEFIYNSVPNLTTRSVYNVPARTIFRVKSAIIANHNANSACCQRIWRNGMPKTGFISVPGGSTVQVNFDPPITFLPGEWVQVRNGASSGPISFTVIGERDYLR